MKRDSLSALLVGLGLLCALTLTQCGGGGGGNESGGSGGSGTQSGTGGSGTQVGVTPIVVPQVSIGGSSTITIGMPATYTATPQNLSQPFQSIVWKLDGVQIAQGSLIAQVTASTVKSYVLSVTVVDSTGTIATAPALQITASAVAPPPPTTLIVSPVPTQTFALAVVGGPFNQTTNNDTFKIGDVFYFDFMATHPEVNTLSIDFQVTEAAKTTTTFTFCPSDPQGTILQSISPIIVQDAHGGTKIQNTTNNTSYYEFNTQAGSNTPRFILSNLTVPTICIYAGISDGNPTHKQFFGRQFFASSSPTILPTTPTISCATSASTPFGFTINGSWTKTPYATSDNFQFTLYDNSTLNKIYGTAYIPVPQPAVNKIAVKVESVSGLVNDNWLSLGSSYLTVDSIVVDWKCSDGYTQKASQIYTKGSNLKFPDRFTFMRPTAP